MPRRWLRFSFACALFLPGLDASVSRGVSLSCARNELPPSPIVAAPQPVVAEARPAPEPPAAAKPTPPDPKVLLRSWVQARLPAGATLDEDGPELVIVHKARKGDTVRDLAAAYVDLTTLYSEGDLVSAIFKANAKMHHGPLAEGSAIRIPRVVTEVPKTGDEARLGWPKDDPALRGIYANATMAGHPSFPSLLDKMAQRGMNALVIDVKDVTGYFTYPSKIPLAAEVKANKHVTVSSFSRLVRFAHARGIRVVARVTCFRDENVGPQKHALAVQRRGGGAHVAPSKIVDWLDPANEQVQAYLVDVVDEALEAGVDEIQLDYVRYPTEGTWDADFKLKDRGLTTVQVITDFVKRIHERTLKAHAALSLDVFGVVAWRDKRDIDATGQDLRELAPHIEALSPMVYPSHFADGFNGYEKPGDHADVVGIGTRRAIQEIENAGLKVPVRPWVQAFPWKTTTFGAAYVADQIASAKSVGASGWLAWNSGGEYGATFGAVPVKKTVVAMK
ncbi:MAG: hypothetical protein HYV09_20385 [Deltaproteobacteria bacterium]|nr:hypothetical protein [Deltaproteobacteria bacterium]